MNSIMATTENKDFEPKYENWHDRKMKFGEQRDKKTYYEFYKEEPKYCKWILDRHIENEKSHIYHYQQYLRYLINNGK